MAIDRHGRHAGPDEPAYAERIVAPFAPETPASGSMPSRHRPGVRRRRPGERVLVHFGGVDRIADGAAGSTACCAPTAPRRRTWSRSAPRLAVADDPGPAAGYRPSCEDRPVRARFEELDRQTTPMGEISVRRRLDPVLCADVYEVKLDDEHLMSNVFTAAEIALADLAIAELDGTGLHVVVGGLGLGYTARAALADHRVRSVEVVEAIPAVIGWQERGLLPGAGELVEDDRCQLVEGDFFAIVRDGGAFGPSGRDRYDAILLDVDHTPTHVLHPSHASFYGEDGLRRLAGRLRRGGVFGLWSDRPDDDFLARARHVFTSCEAHEVRFPNHHTGGEGVNTVYVALA